MKQFGIDIYQGMEPASPIALHKNALTQQSAVSMDLDLVLTKFHSAIYYKIGDTTDSLHFLAQSTLQTDWKWHTWAHRVLMVHQDLFPFSFPHFLVISILSNKSMGNHKFLFVIVF